MELEQMEIGAIKEFKIGSGGFSSDFFTQSHLILTSKRQRRRSPFTFQI